MADPRDTVHLSILGDHAHPNPPTAGEPGAGSPRAPKPWLSIWFRCANLYSRAYRTPDGRGYIARCPKCGKSLRFMIGPGGTPRRAFEVSC